jgi:hypothetical protein
VCARTRGTMRMGARRRWLGGRVGDANAAHASTSGASTRRTAHTHPARLPSSASSTSPTPRVRKRVLAGEQRQERDSKVRPFVWFLLTSFHLYSSLSETLPYHLPLPTLEPARCVAVHLRRVGRALSAFDMSRGTCAASDVLPCV